MNILLIGVQIPYPLIDGGKKAVFYPLKYLSSRGHSIHFICLSEEYNAEQIKIMEKYCTIDVIYALKKPTARGVISSLFESTPYDIKRFHNRGMLKKINDVMSTKKFDIIQVEGVHPAYYAMEIKKYYNIPIVIREQNVHYINIARMIPFIKNPVIKAFLMIELRKIKKYELQSCAKFDHVMTVSDIDRDLLISQNALMSCQTVPVGVDLNEFEQQDSNVDDKSILWLGSLQWKPNQDSFLWFYREIYPKIVEKSPEVKLNIVGSNPPTHFLSFKDPGVNMIGHVDDVRRYLERACVCVVPLRVGSGIRVKILEMLAMKKAIVSTTVGCEGLPVKDGEHLLVADQPEQFADAVIKLLENPGLRVRIGNSGYQLVKDQYSWDHIAGMFERIYDEVIRKHNKKYS